MAAETDLPKFDRSVSLLSWGYNEQESIEAFLRRMVSLLEHTVVDFEIIFVNDGSTDLTGKRADAFAERDGRVRVIHNSRNMNVGRAASRAIAAANGEILFWQTVDWSYDLTHVRLFLELTKHYDVVQGVRPVAQNTPGKLSLVALLRGIGRRSDTIPKAIISVTNYWLVRLLFGVPLSDFQNVTFYKSAFVKTLKLHSVTGFSNPELLIRAFARGARFLEVPIRFLPRDTGEAKGTRLGTVVRSILEIFHAWLRWGIHLRGARKSGVDNQIHRVNDRGQLSGDVRRLVEPLFKEYR